MVIRRAVIDTNIYSLALRGEKRVLDVLGQLDAINITVISLGELEAGFYRGNRLDKNRAELRRFLASPRVQVLALDASVTEYYASIVAALKRAGTPIPTNDVWIAALAQYHHLPLYTRDEHFGRIPNLTQLSPD